MRIVLTALLLTASLVPAQADTTSSTLDAFSFCRMMDRTGLQSQPCEVGAGEVTITLDMTAEDARTACPQLAKSAKAKQLSFDRGWRLAVKSPYSNGSSIAYCKLLP